MRQGTYTYTHKWNGITEMLIIEEPGSVKHNARDKRISVRKIEMTLEEGYDIYQDLKELYKNKE